MSHKRRAMAARWCNLTRPVTRAGTGQIAHAMDTSPKGRPIEDQVGALREQIRKCERQIKAHIASGRLDRANRVVDIMEDAIAKLQLAADRFAQGKRV